MCVQGLVWMCLLAACLDVLFDVCSDVCSKSADMIGYRKRPATSLPALSPAIPHTNNARAHTSTTLQPSPAPHHPILCPSRAPTRLQPHTCTNHVCDMQATVSGLKEELQQEKDKVQQETMRTEELKASAMEDLLTLQVCVTTRGRLQTYSCRTEIGLDTASLLGWQCCCGLRVPGGTAKFGATKLPQVMPWYFKIRIRFSRCRFHMLVGNSTQHATAIL